MSPMEGQLDRTEPHGGRLALRLAAEFAVIVTGVLVALAVDAVVERRQEREILDQALGDIAAQVQDQHYTLGVMTESVLPEKMAALERLVRFLRVENAPLQDTLLLVEDMRDGMLTGVPWLESDRYEALRSSGLLRLLRDPSLAQRLAGTFAAPDVLLGQADRYDTRYSELAMEILPMEFAPRRNPLAGYGRNFRVPEFGTPGRLDDFVIEVRRRREELLPIAQAEVWAAAARWSALGRLRIAMRGLLEDLKPWNADPLPEGIELGSGPVEPGEPDGRRFAPEDTPAGYAEGRYRGMAQIAELGR